MTESDSPLPTGQTVLSFENVTAVAWRPKNTQLAILRANEVLLVNPDLSAGEAGTPESPTVVFTVPTEDYYDVVGMTWSPDGESLALEVHSAEQTY